MRKIDIHNPAIAAWRPLVEKYRGNLPGDRVVDRLLTWIGIESGGNACSLDNTRKAALATGHVPDVGPFQLYFDRPTSRIHGFTSAQLRAGCVGTTQAGSCSPAVRELQVKVSLAWLQDVVAEQTMRLAAMGVVWPERDQWRWYKFSTHGLPAVALCMMPLVIGTLGRPPASWHEFRATCEAMPNAPIATAAALPVANGCTACLHVRPIWHVAFDNAEEMDLADERGVV